jgi:hypothetical protein
VLKFTGTFPRNLIADGLAQVASATTFPSYDQLRIDGVAEYSTRDGVVGKPSGAGTFPICGRIENKGSPPERICEMR